MRPHAAVDGDGPLVVFGSSLGTTHELWEPQARSLRGATLVRYDHRGHGGTPVGDEPFEIADLAEDVLDLVDALGAERFSFVGLSLGGAVGQWLGANSDRVDRLVLACTATSFDPDTYLGRAAIVREQGVEAVADAGVGRWFSEADAATVARFRAMLAATPAAGYAACCEALARWEFAGELPRIGVPTLVIAGGRDVATPPERLEQIAAGIPGARLETLPAAHLANVEQPTAFTALLADHLGLEAR